MARRCTFGLPALLLLFSSFTTPVHAQCLDYGDYFQVLGETRLVGAWDMTVLGDYAFTVQGDTLRVLDIANPRSPTLIGQLPLTSASSSGASAYGIAGEGSHVFVAEAYGGLDVIDVSNPASPEIVGYTDTPDRAIGVFALGDYAYVADQVSGLQIVDVSNPTNPRIVGSVITGGAALDVKVIGSLAYVLSDLGLYTVDVSNPRAPLRMGRADISGFPWHFDISGSFAYVVGSETGMDIIDLSVPQAPVRLTTVPIEGRDVLVIGSQAFVCGAFSDFQILDISNPILPIVEVPGLYPYAFNTLAAHGDILLGGAERFGVFLVRSPASPVPTGRIEPPDVARLLAVRGPYAFIADTEAGLQVADISNPALPVLVGAADTPGSAHDVALGAQHAFVADKYHGLQVIDISVPSSPVLITSVDTPGYANHVLASATHVFLADGHGGLHIFDVSDPTIPALVTSIDSVGWIGGLALSGSTLFAANGDSSRIMIIDVSDVGSPIVLSTFGHRIENMEIADGHLYAAGGFGLDVYDISNPLVPVSMGSVETPWQAFDVALSGRYAYVTWDQGLAVVDVLDPSGPKPVSITYGWEGSVDTDGSNVYAIAATSENILVTNFHRENPYTLHPEIAILPLQCEALTGISEPMSLNAVAVPNGIAVTWDADPASDYVAFHVERSLQADRGFIRLTQDPLPAFGSISRFIDRETAPGVTYYYRLEALSRNGESEFFGPVSARWDAQHGVGVLRQSSPNPFSGPATEIAFSLPGAGQTRLRILDIAGRTVRLVLDAWMAPGEQVATWDGRDDQGAPVAPGVYLYRLDGPGVAASRRLLKLP